MPVATLAIGEAGARNAGLLAAQILALSDPALAERLAAFRAAETAAVAETVGGGLSAPSDGPLPPGSTIGILGGGQLGPHAEPGGRAAGLRRPPCSARPAAPPPGSATR